MKKTCLFLTCIILMMCCSCRSGNAALTPSEGTSSKNIPEQNRIEQSESKNDGNTPTETTFVDEIITVIDELDNLEYVIDDIDDKDLD